MTTGLLIHTLRSMFSNIITQNIKIIAMIIYVVVIQRVCTRHCCPMFSMAHPHQCIRARHGQCERSITLCNVTQGIQIHDKKCIRRFFFLSFHHSFALYSCPSFPQSFLPSPHTRRVLFKPSFAKRTTMTTLIFPVTLML